MKTFDQLAAVTSLENNALLVANNADNTATNKITFSNIKSQILNDVPDHYESSTVVANGALDTSDEEATNGNVHLNHIENNTVRSSHTITGAGTVAVTSDSNGNITVTGTDTNTHYASSTVVGATSIADTNGVATNGNVFLNHIENGTVVSSHKIEGSGSVTVTSDANGAITVAGTDTDTHYASSTVVGASNSAKVNAEATNGNVYINHVENDVVTSAHKIEGSGATSVTSDSNGNITVSSSDTHYASSTVVGASNDAVANATATNGNVHLNHIENNTVVSTHSITGSGATSVTSDSTGNITVSSSDTHYASSTVVGASGEATSDATATNGNVYINHIENSAIVSSHNISGSGATSVTSDSNGDITISSTDTWNAYVGATSESAGTAGYLPAATSSEANKYFKGDGTYADPLNGLGTAINKNYTDTYDSDGDDLTTGKAVAAALATLPEPMVFKGSLGTGGTITTLPAAASSGAGKNTGFTYKVIENGTYDSQVAKVGDTFISTGSAWVLIPSGDEPSGTVTSIGIEQGTGISVTGGPVTSSGTITVAHGATSEQSTVTNTGRTYIQSITLDTMGHVTGISSATETVVDTDTHYASSIIVGASNSAKANATATNGNVYINHIENDAVTAYHKIEGSGLTSVTSDSSGNISISSSLPSEIDGGLETSS